MLAPVVFHCLCLKPILKGPVFHQQGLGSAVIVVGSFLPLLLLSELILKSVGATSTLRFPGLIGLLGFTQRAAQSRIIIQRF